MDIQKIIQSYISGMVAEKIAKATNLPAETVSKYVGRAVPLFAGAILKNMKTAEGRESFFEAIKNDHDGSVFDKVEHVIDNPEMAKGEKILGHVFGTEVAHAEAQVASEVGVSQEQSKQMMEALAPMMMGALGKEQTDKGLGLDDVMGMMGGMDDKMDMAKKGFSLLKMFRK